MKKMIAVFVLACAFTAASANNSTEMNAKKTNAFVQPFSTSYMLDTPYIWFTDADLTNCDLFQTNLHGATLAGADLTGAEVSGLNLLTLADFKGVRVTDEQVFRLLDAMGVDVRTRQR